LRGYGQGANNPYQSVSPSQGACRDISGPAYGYYYDFVCELGPLASGASAQITAVVTVNESMHHFATLLPNAYEGGFQDDNNSNNEAVDTIRQLAARPLEEAEAHGASRGVRVRRLHPAGDDHCERRQENGRRPVPGLQSGRRRAGMAEGDEGKPPGREGPVSRITPELNVTYKLKVKAKRGGAKPLKVTVTFQVC
jgi:hypothetical protein